MVLRSENVLISAVLCLLLLVVGCAPAPRFYLSYGALFTETDLERILAEKPLAAGENYKVVTLGKAREISHHVVQIRDRELPHIHKEHDLSVVMLRGQGYLMLGQRRIELAVGDVLFVSHGAPHYFVNTFHEPSVALILFSPAFDGKDSIPVQKPSTPPTV